MREYITIEGRNGSFQAYIARPNASPASAVVVLQELFGVNADIREHCDKLAELGYLAVAPDLYWRLEPGVDLNVRSKEDWDHGVRLNQAYDHDTGAVDIKDTVDAVARLTECNGRVALMGYCIGGLMTFLTAARFGGIAAAVAYHGGDTEKHLDEVDGLHAPILMHLAGEDEFMPKAARDAIVAAFAGKSNATIYIYPGQRHAFSRYDGEHYNAEAAALANGRTRDFLRQTLS
jgi:carboxymethylenebutenolidase